MTIYFPDPVFSQTSLQSRQDLRQTRWRKGKKWVETVFFTYLLNFYFQHPSRYLKCFTHEIGGFTTTFKIKVFNENWRRRSSLKVLSKVWVSRAKNLSSVFECWRLFHIHCIWLLDLLDYKKLGFSYVLKN